MADSKTYWKTKQILIRKISVAVRLYFQKKGLF